MSWKRVSVDLMALLARMLSCIVGFASGVFLNTTCARETPDIATLVNGFTLPVT